MKLICTRFNFATTVGIISGHPRYDNQTARIIDAIRSQSKEPIEFVGVIGDQYKDKLKQSYASTSVVDHDEIVITRNYNELVQDFVVTPYRSITHYKNAQLLKILKQKHFFEDLYAKNTPAMIMVGNYSLIRRAFPLLNKVYQQKNAEKPLRLAFDLMNAYRTINNQEYLDYLYYNLAKVPQSLNGYVFPSMCIGYQGLFKAFQFLQKQKTDGSQSFRYKEFSVQVAQLVKKARNDYRSSKGFTQDQYLTVLAPGSCEKQIKFSFDRFSQALKLFNQQSQIKGVTKGFFKVLVLLPENQKITSLIKSKASSLGEQITFVSANQKYAALCAADFAVLHNGDITVQAAACQLPAVVINSMSNYHAYISYLYNGHESPLNVSTNFEGYQQLLGGFTVLPSKVCSIMLQHFKSPKLRYYYAKLYRDQIQQQLSMLGRNPDLNVSRTGIQAAAEDILNKINLRKQLKNVTPLNHYERKQKLSLI